MTLKERVDKAFNRYGEDFLINDTTSAKGFFQILDQNRMNAYFDVVEQSYITKPALIVMVPADTSIAVSDTVNRDGRTYTAKKIAKPRVKSTIAMQVVLLT